MKYRLFRHADFRRRTESLARIRIAVELREVAAGNVYAQPMAGQEDVRRADQINFVFVNFIGFQQLRFVYALPITRTKDAFAKVEGKAIGGYVNQLDDPIGVGAVGRGKEFHLDRPSDGERRGHGFARINQNVFAVFQRTLIFRPRQRWRTATVVAAQRRHRIIRIVGVVPQRRDHDR